MRRLSPPVIQVCSPSRTGTPADNRLQLAGTMAAGLRSRRGSLFRRTLKTPGPVSIIRAGQARRSLFANLRRVRFTTRNRLQDDVQRQACTFALVARHRQQFGITPAPARRIPAGTPASDSGWL